MRLSVSYFMKECGLPTVTRLHLIVLSVVPFSLSHLISFVAFSPSLLLSFLRDVFLVFF